MDPWPARRGDWPPEHVFTLRQSFAAWQYHQKLIPECEIELRNQMAGLTDQTKSRAEHLRLYLLPSDFPMGKR